MAENASAGKIAQTGPSPYLKVAGVSPPQGAHLTWFTTLSQALQGANGSGKVYGVVDAANKEIGKWKSFGGLVFIGVTFDTAGTYKVNLPGVARHTAPMLLSDNQVIWPSSGTLTVTTSIPSVTGWMQYWG